MVNAMVVLTKLAIFQLNLNLLILSSFYVQAKNNNVQDDLVKFLTEHDLYGKKFSCEETGVKYEFSAGSDVDPKFPLSSVVRDVHKNNIQVLGRRNTSFLQGVPGEWVMAHYGSGGAVTECKNTSSIVMFLCDRNNKKGDFHFLYQEKCDFIFELKSNSVCGKPPGMSGWSVFFLILFICFCCYFIIGCLYLRFQRGAKGIEQLPNRTFWFGLGNKIADCFNVICRCDKYLSDPIDQLDSTYADPGGYTPITDSPPVISPTRTRDTDLLNP